VDEGGVDMELLLALGWFAQHFVMALAVTLAFGFVYVLATPHSELALIRSGNLAAAVGFVGVLIGYAIQVNHVFSRTPDPFEAVIWAGVALAAQLIALTIARFAMPNLATDIEAGRLSAGVVQAGIGVVVGLITAPALAS